MLRRAVEPAVVRHVDEEVDRLAVLGILHVATGQERVGVLVADQGAEASIAEREAGELLADRDRVIVIVRGERVHERQPVAERNVFAERHSMHLVEAFAKGAVLVDQKRRAVASPLFLFADDNGGQSEELVGSNFDSRATIF